MRAVLACVLLMTLGSSVPLAAQATATDDDPFIWLEDWTGKRSMDWVEAHNAKTTTVLEADARYPGFYAEALKIAQAEDRIPYGRFIGGEIYNFWQDEAHVRGILRKASLDSYRSGNPQWTTVLDLDAVAKAENANWVYKGMSCAKPAERRCLISLSDGGEDAVTIREFDLGTMAFVDGGFVLPKSKQDAAWVDENTLLVTREWEPGQVGKTGYPFIAKHVKRGQPLSAAVELYRGDPQDGGYGVNPVVLRDGDNRTLEVINRALDTFTQETYIVTPAGVKQVALPQKGYFSDMVDGKAIARLQERWTPPGMTTTFPEGSLVAMDLDALVADPAHPKPVLVYAPTAKESLQGVSSTKDVLLVSILDNVRSRILRFVPAANGTWTRSEMKLPDDSTIDVISSSSRDERALFDVTNFVEPTSLWLADAGTGEASKIMTLPAKFDSSDLVVEQQEATSTDGTKIPYFVVHKRGMALDGSNPTLLYAYGGFEIPMAPSYSAIMGKLWLEKGGVFALANIRGGGEFGPAWHEAGLGVKRQIIYDDFASVAKDMIARKITSPAKLGIKGGSNGGLLMGVEFTQHPELWKAVIIDVPLLDMIRISKIAAGASWEGEYGSVTDPAVRAFWEKTSPYQNLRKGVDYPEPFIFTTTKDDRVGPQHARKFAAKMESMGLPFYFYENTEGGHAAGANLRQQAHTNALEFTYLARKLMGDSNAQ